MTERRVRVSRVDVGDTGCVTRQHWAMLPSRSLVFSGWVSIFAFVGCDSGAGATKPETTATNDGTTPSPGSGTSSDEPSGNPSVSESIPTAGPTVPTPGAPSASDEPSPGGRAGDAGGGAAGLGGAGPGGAPPGAGGGDGPGGTGLGGSSGSGGIASEPVGGGGSGLGGAGSDFTGTPIVIVGGYDYGSNSYPLRTFDIDKATGALTQRGTDVDAGPNPTYLALGPSGRVLYVANESDDAGGGLTSVTIGDDGQLAFLNHQTGSDAGFVHVAVDPTGSYALGASYNGGSVSVFPIEGDGSLGAELQSRDFGDGAQSHCVGFVGTGGFVLVPNKGNDEVAQLVLGADGMLSDNTPGSVASGAGAGPRHIALHPNGEFAFVINELDSSLTPYALSASGTLTAGSTVSALPEGFQGQNSGAHVELSPDGRFLYGSNRGHDSIAVFEVDPTTGALSLLEHESSRGSTPRDFEMDPAGDVLVVANQDSGTLAVFAIATDGSLSPLGDTVNGPPSPAAVQFVYLE